MTELVAPVRVTGWRNAIIAGFATGGITVSAWGTRLPALTEELQASTGVIGTVLAFITIGSIGGLLAATPIAARLGTRNGVPLALLVIAAGMGLLSAGIGLRAIPLLAIAFAIVGFGIGLVDVLLNVEGSAVERAAARTLMPLMHAAWSVGVAVGSGIGAACAALGVTPSQQFGGEAVLIAVVAVVVRRHLPAHAAEDLPADQRRAGAAIRGWLRGWLDVRLLLIGIVLLGVELGEGSANTWLTLGVQREHGQTAAIAALFFTAFAIGEAAARVLAGPVVDRIGRVPTMRITTAIGVVGLVLFILGGTWWLVLLGVLLWAVGVSMGFPLGMSAAAESGPNPAARVSVVASIGYFASLAGPPAIGWIAERTGLLGAFWLIVALMAAAFAASGSVAKSGRAATPTPSAPSALDDRETA
ncbi:MFS transporter [Amnibacterium setariae]|uniref:MFS transporter n=1 Tax=Amnibacterium setariae TaxID=2306585 RepID=A0A3A1U267_9MICO|nr:MFS transporter [Amnibacterium setariae]RIX30440.1 MFS transporter [Amnibacterium setariae]